VLLGFTKTTSEFLGFLSLLGGTILFLMFLFFPCLFCCSLEIHYGLHAFGLEITFTTQILLAVVIY
jgi:hypothetical protein